MSRSTDVRAEVIVPEQKDSIDTLLRTVDFDCMCSNNGRHSLYDKRNLFDPVNTLFLCDS